jgi:hypothetical protein
MYEENLAQLNVSQVQVVPRSRTSTLMGSNLRLKFEI